MTTKLARMMDRRFENACPRCEWPQNSVTGVCINPACGKTSFQIWLEEREREVEIAKNDPNNPLFVQLDRDLEE